MSRISLHGALMNAMEFCDKIMVLDNMSEDRTYEIVTAIAKEHDHVEVIRVKDGNNTHRYIEGYAGKPVWVIKIDGDEIFSPSGLLKLKNRLHAGEFDNFWMIEAPILHAIGISFEVGKAFGYTQPAARGSMYLYNFNAIDSWRAGRTERLHGLKTKFREGYFWDKAYPYWIYHTWSESELKGLHLCFMPRSPLDTNSYLEGQWVNRFNLAEIRRDRRLHRRIAHAVSRKYSRQPYTKMQGYAKGEVTEFDISDFGTPLDFQQYDPECQTVVDIIREVTQSRSSWIKKEVF